MMQRREATVLGFAMLAALGASIRVTRTGTEPVERAPTSFAVSGLPSWNFTPGVSLKFQVRPSSLTVWLAASHGSSLGGLPM